MIEVTRIISPDEARPLVKEFLTRCVSAGPYRQSWSHKDEFWAYESDNEPFIISLERAVDGFMALVKDVVAGAMEALGLTPEKLKDMSILLSAAVARTVLEYCLGVRKCPSPK